MRLALGEVDLFGAYFFAADWAGIALGRSILSWPVEHRRATRFAGR